MATSALKTVPWPMPRELWSRPFNRDVYGYFYKLGVAVVGVLRIRVLSLGVCIHAPDIGNIPRAVLVPCKSYIRSLSKA